MVQESYKASSPGSLMLMGEHAVLQGKHALTAAIARRISVTLTPRVDQEIWIESTLGRYQTSIPSLNSSQCVDSFRFVMAAIKVYQSKLKTGFDLFVESEFSDKIGFGSSAAVVVATLYVLAEWMREEISDSSLSSSGQSGSSNTATTRETWKLELFKRAKAVITQVQGSGSGADVAASVMGGIVFYQASSNLIERVELNRFPTLLSVYSGYKTPTPQVIAIVKERCARAVELHEKIFEAMEYCTLEAYRRLKEENWETVGDLLNIQHGLLVALGVSDQTLDHLVYQLRALPSVQGAKISGSGLGDCVIGLVSNVKSIQTQAQASEIPADWVMPVSIAEQGVLLEMPARGEMC